MTDNKRTPPPEAIQELSAIDQWVAYSRNKIPISPNGSRAKSSDPDTWGSLAEAKFIRRVQGLPGVGFMFSTDDDYVGIDLDEAIDPNTDEIRPWALEVVEEINSYTEYSPSGLGLHIWVRGDLPRNGARLRDGRKIEVYKQGRYFTVTGRHYAGTPQAICERDLMSWFSREFDHDKPEIARHDDGIVWESCDVETWLADALGYICADDYHEWIHVGMAIKSELGERGFSYWDRWSKTSDKYRQGATIRAWRSLKSSGPITIATVVWMAEKGGFSVPSGGVKNPLHMDDDWDQWIDAQSGVVDPDAMDNGLSIIVHDVVDLYADTSDYEPDIIGPGVLGAGDMMLLFGPPKSMKSMVIMDMFRNFALGRDWCGFTVDRPLRTFYCQFEVKGDKMRQRLQLAKMPSSDLEAMRGNFLVTERFTPQLNAEFVMEFAELALKKFKGSMDVLILDPMANIYTGDSENDNTQMSKFIRQIKVLRNAIDPDVALVLVHHSSKLSRQDRQSDPFNSGRGASSLRGAYDAGMYLDRVKEEDSAIKIWTELRNGPRRPAFEVEFDAGRFSIREDSGSDGDGDDDPVDAGGVVVEVLRSEAKLGRCYPVGKFCSTFAGMAGMGNSDWIRREISRLLDEQTIGFFRRDDIDSEVHRDGLPALHHRSIGYLACSNMSLVIDGAGAEVRPTIFKRKDGSIR